MKRAYPLKIDKETMAYASGVNLGISTKVAIEISSMLRGMSVAKAKAKLERVIAMKDAVPYRRFNKDVGHKPGIGPGRYPIKASGEVLRLLKSAEANAIDKGLADEALIIMHINANRAAQQYRYGRQSRRKMKRTHLQIVLAEDESLKKAASKAKPKGAPKAEKKPEAKTESKPAAEKKADIKAEPKPKAETVSEKKPEAKTESKPAAEKKAEPEAKAESKPAEKKAEHKAEEKPAKKADATAKESKDIKEPEKKAPQSPSQK